MAPTSMRVESAIYSTSYQRGNERSLARAQLWRQGSSVVLPSNQLGIRIRDPKPSRSWGPPGPSMKLMCAGWSSPPLMISSLTYRRLAALLAVVVLLAPAGQHSAGAVLCIEFDGSIEVEGRRGAGCGDSSHDGESAIEHEALGHEEEVRHCSDCVDIAFPGSVDEDCSALKTKRAVGQEVVASADAGETAFATKIVDLPPRTSRSNVRTTDVFGGLAPRSVVLLI